VNSDVFSAKNDSNLKQKSNFFKFFISLLKNDLRVTTHKIRLNFRIKPAIDNHLEGKSNSKHVLSAVEWANFEKRRFTQFHILYLANRQKFDNIVPN